jgi:mannitol-1-phosphate/altronate dehydrogenase
VGRDLPRKLGFNERLIGAARLNLKHSIVPKHTALGIAAALFFRARDENEKLFENDRQFARELAQHGVDHIMEAACGLDAEGYGDLISLIKCAHELLVAWDHSTDLSQDLEDRLS